MSFLTITQASITSTTAVSLEPFVDKQLYSVTLKVQFSNILCHCSCGNNLIHLQPIICLLCYIYNTPNHNTKAIRIYTYVHSVEQKSIGLKFSKSRTGSDMWYSCHHDSSRFTFPILAHS